MFDEQVKEKRFCHYISGHIGGRYPSGRKRAVRDMVMNKMIVDINVF